MCETDVGHAGHSSNCRGIAQDRYDGKCRRRDRGVAYECRGYRQSGNTYERHCMVTMIEASLHLACVVYVWMLQFMWCFVGPRLFGFGPSSGLRVSLAVVFVIFSFTNIWHYLG